MKIHRIVQDVKKWFDWTPVAVSLPAEVYCTYADKGRMFLGYEVKVTYLYHGKRRYLFAVDEEKLGLFTRDRACAKALDFYRVKQEQTKQYKKNENNK